MANGTIKNTLVVPNQYAEEDLKDYNTPSNMFIAPRDGYVYMWSEPNVSSGKMLLRIGTRTLGNVLSKSFFADSEGREKRDAIFVKQGTSLYVDQLSFSAGQFGIRYRYFY